MAVDGHWNVAIKTPVGTRRTVIEFFTEDGVLRGVSRSDREQLVLDGLTQTDNRLTWSTSVTKPLRMVLHFDVEIDGDSLSGTARGGPMSAAKVSGSRLSAAQDA